MWVDRNGRELAKEGSPAPVRDFSLSLDGARLAYSMLDPVAKSRDIWVRDVRRGIASRLTFDAGEEEWPVLSPDGQRVAYQSRAASGQSLVLVTAADGSGGVDTLGTFPGSAGPEDWSSDGRWVVLTIAAERPPDLWAVATDGSREQKKLISEDGTQRDGRLSPDGRWLAYTSSESGRQEVYVRPFAGGGGKWQISSGGGLDAHWRGDGRELFFRDTDDAIWSVTIDAAAGFSVGTPQRLFQRAMLRALYNRNRFVVSRDGQRFLINASTGVAARPTFQVTLDWPSELRKR